MADDETRDDEERTMSADDAIGIVNLPKLKEWRAKKFYDYENEVVDYESLEKLNEAIRSARMALFKLTEAINIYERKETTAKTQYDREWRRAYLGGSERTDSMRKARADLLCEQYEDDMIVAGQVKGEFVRMSNSIRLELQTLQALGNNLRQQIKME